MNKNIKRLREITRALTQTLDKIEDNVDDYIDADAEIQRVIKKEYNHFQKRKKLRILKYLNGDEEGETTRYYLTYRPTARRVLNEDELEKLIPDSDLRDLLYSKKAKTIKEIEKICSENGIKQAELFIKKLGKPQLKVKEI